MDYTRKYYTLDIPYLINHFIYEWDISKANLNVLYWKGVISEEDYNCILNYNKGMREIYFGNLIKKDPNIGQLLSEGLSELRKLFIESNGLTDFDILSVKNDAIFVIGDKVKAFKFGNIEFKCKNIYSSYFRLNVNNNNRITDKLELYYFYDAINGIENIDVKGINDHTLILHRGYFLDFICESFNMIQCSQANLVIQYIQNFYKKYTDLQLPLQYYREFNSESKYRLTFPNGMQFLSDIPEGNGYLNIINNQNIIREFHALASEIMAK